MSQTEDQGPALFSQLLTAGSCEIISEYTVDDETLTILHFSWTNTTQVSFCCLSVKTFIVSEMITGVAVFGEGVHSCLVTDW